MSFLKSIFSPEKKERLDQGLSASKKSFFSKLGTAVAGKSKIDADLLDELEEVLIRSDVGVATTLKIINALEARVAKDKYLGTTELSHILREEITLLLRQYNEDEVKDFNAPLPHKPHVIMVVGVNGVGKTTTIGKLAHHYKTGGKKLVLGAADTFRAGAIDQLQVWADRVGVELLPEVQRRGARLVVEVGARLDVQGHVLHLDVEAAGLAFEELHAGGSSTGR